MPPRSAIRSLCPEIKRATGDTCEWAVRSIVLYGQVLGEDRLTIANAIRDTMVAFIHGTQSSKLIDCL